MRFDLRQVRKRYAADYQANQKDAKVLERELKRYLVLRVLHPNTRYAMAGPTDGFWHTFLIFTRKYAQFCQQVGGRFLHHTPAVSESTRELRQLQKDYEVFCRDYSLVFKEPPSSPVWPSLEAVKKAIGKKR
jgi:hypothetical protein